MPLRARPPWLLPAILAGLLLVYGGLVFGFAAQWRKKLRDDVLRREADTIHAVAQMQLATSNGRLAEFGKEFAIDDMFEAVLKSSKLKGVFAVQLFDAHGALRHATPLPPEDADNPVWWPQPLARAESRFVAAGSWEMISPQLALQHGTAERLPLLDVAVPLHDAAAGGAFGVARYWIDGAEVRDELARNDHGIWLQAVAALTVGLLLAGAFGRLASANRQLERQRADLVRANEELDFAAKTGALGAISAHLIHGLKNPLAGIEGFVAENADGHAVEGEAWRAAMDTARRLRAMVNEVAMVLRDEAAGGPDFAVPTGDVVDAARQRAAPLAAQAGVDLRADAATEAAIPSRAATLSGLVLANLLTNAVEAAAPGGRVRLEARANDGTIEFLVSDSGAGLSEEIRVSLFRPVRSTKRGGGGVGLAISHRLARHAGGELTLVRTDATGTVFQLRVPAKTAG